MSFVSLEFLIFLPLALLAYWLTPGRCRWIVLLLASVCFYAFAGFPAFLLILMLITVSFFCPPVITALVGLSGLFIFKYTGWSPLGMALPLGISFYTFQTLSYSIDVKAGKCAKEKNFFRYMLYVLFFPQLVAGPIERASDLLPQLKETKHFKDIDFEASLCCIVKGFAKKLIIADYLGIYVDKVYGSPADADSLSLILATIFFALQIYCDFSGYSDIARGVAGLFGIRLMDNFNMPYSAFSVKDFWRRWHISLTKWFTDYVYIPLGGNRCGRARHILNLLIVFLLSGIWHGAGLTFIIWGLLHGIMISLESVCKPRKDNFISKAGTFAFVTFAWIFFRAQDLTDALVIIKRIFTPACYTLLPQALGFTAVTFAVCLLLVFLTFVIDRLPGLTKGRFTVLLYFLLITATIAFRCYMLTGYGSSAFIYFQF